MRYFKNAELDAYFKSTDCCKDAFPKVIFGYPYASAEPVCQCMWILACMHANVCLFACFVCVCVACGYKKFVRNRMWSSSNFCALSTVQGVVSSPAWGPGG